jgi:hypothetical protein
MIPLWRIALSLGALIFLLQAPLSLHATANERTWARWRSECADGNGQSCYMYAQAQNSASAPDNVIARKYYARACELKYLQGCKIHSNAALNRGRRRSPATTSTTEEFTAGSCQGFSQKSTVRSSTTTLPGGRQTGQLIDYIKPGSFWDRAGLMENDVVVKINGAPVGALGLGSTPMQPKDKRFIFQIRRGTEPGTVIYSCY